MGEACDDELAFGVGEILEEEVIFNVSFFEESFELLERARLLGDGLGIDSLFSGIDSSVDAIQQEIVGSNFVMCMFFGTCEGGAEDLISDMMFLFERWKSRDRQSAV